MIILGGGLAGIVYFHEMRSAAPAKLAAFAIGALVCAGGISLLLLKAKRQQSFAAAAAAATAAAVTAAGAVVERAGTGEVLELAKKRPLLVSPLGVGPQDGVAGSSAPALPEEGGDAASPSRATRVMSALRLSAVTERTSLAAAAGTVGGLATPLRVSSLSATAVPSHTGSAMKRQWYDLTVKEAIQAARGSARASTTTS